MRNVFRIIKISNSLSKTITGLSFLIVFGSLVELVSPLLLKKIVDELVSKTESQSKDFTNLIILIGLIFIANTLGVAITAVGERLGDHFSGVLRQILTERFYSKVLSLPQSYFDSELSGKIVNQLSRGIISVLGFINVATNFILPMFLQSLLIIALLIFYSPLTALFMFTLFPIYWIISYRSSLKWGAEEVKKNKLEDIGRGRIQEVIGNIKIIKGFGTERSEGSFVSGLLTKINKIYSSQSSTFHLYDFYRNFSLNLILLLANIVVFYSTYTGALTIGEMVLILQLITMARRPLFAMSFILTQVQSAESGSKEFFEILDLKSTEDFLSEDVTERIGSPTISFVGVTFSYQSTETVLKSVSFKIDKNETVALVGESGAGKTTIVNLILKLYEPSSGDIYLGDKKYSELSHRSIRSNIGLVFQENELFSTTIRENVSYGTNASDEQVKKALETANAWEFVSSFSDGMFTEVGERGIKLSGGQKQRIQIARAVLRDAPILILDEATSNLDAKSEKEVQDALANLMKNKLVIIIAHRFSTLQNVDKVIVIENGSISEIGTPKELSQKPGIYNDLLRFQIEGNKKLLKGFELY